MDFNQDHEGTLLQMYGFVESKNSDEAIKYFFSSRIDSDTLAAADVDRLDAPVLVAMLLGTRVRKAHLPARDAFAARARARLLESMPEGRLASLWERIG